MSALPPSQMAAMRTALDDELVDAGAFDQHAVLQARWDAIHECAAQVAELAAISPEPAHAHHRALAAMFADADEAQRDVAARGIEDIEALMRIGLAALTSVTARGHDATAPAVALWREFHHAREAVLVTLLPFAEAA